MNFNITEADTATQKNITQNKLAFSIDEIATLTSLSKAFVRLEIKEGRINATRFGRRILIMKDDLRSYLENGSPGKAENLNK
jgi:excisionase family DNA binding protein